MPRPVADYAQFYEITDTSPALDHQAKELLGDTNALPDGVEAARIVSRYINSRIWDRSVSPPQPINKAKTLLESRFTPASSLFAAPRSSCGAVATLAASLLRSGGFSVRLIHGDRPNSDQHAWNEIWIARNNAWHIFDASSGKGIDYAITPMYLRRAECADWSELRVMLEAEHRQNLERVTP